MPAQGRGTLHRKPASRRGGIYSRLRAGMALRSLEHKALPCVTRGMGSEAEQGRVRVSAEEPGSLGDWRCSLSNGAGGGPDGTYASENLVRGSEWGSGVPSPVSKVRALLAASVTVFFWDL